MQDNSLPCTLLIVLGDTNSWVGETPEIENIKSPGSIMIPQYLTLLMTSQNDMTQVAYTHMTHSAHTHKKHPINKEFSFCNGINICHVVHHENVFKTENRHTVHSLPWFQIPCFLAVFVADSICHNITLSLSVIPHKPAWCSVPNLTCYTIMQEAAHAACFKVSLPLWSGGGWFFLSAPWAKDIMDPLFTLHHNRINLPS